ncbi:MLP protein [Melia azedarach]|uniref:MLP protein n=1 Tax=Melia azedarach TaxID=155640 RepID=A0ACC1XGQ3_MELAZ|nr:MLP protein [Melia azedarach]
MSLAGKMETVVQVKSPAAKFHEGFSCKPHIVASMSPQSIQGCDLLEGQWGNPGCIICWRYFHGGELGTVIEVKASAAQFHEVFSCRPHLVTSTSPGNVQSCELMEGEWGKPGSVICWTFTRDKNPQTVKELVEIIDNEDYVTVYKLIEGWVLENVYKSFYSIAKITPKDDGSLVHFTYKYEKQNENIPDLESKVLQMMIQNVKDIDAYLIQQQKVEIVKEFGDAPQITQQA